MTGQKYHYWRTDISQQSVSTVCDMGRDRLLHLLKVVAYLSLCSCAGMYRVALYEVIKVRALRSHEYKGVGSLS
jgi:hypothetical protein